jgi:hypothetical protein
MVESLATPERGSILCPAPWDGFLNWRIRYALYPSYVLLVRPSIEPISHPIRAWIPLGKAQRLDREANEAKNVSPPDSARTFRRSSPFQVSMTSNSSLAEQAQAIPTITKVAKMIRRCGRKQVEGFGLHEGDKAIGSQAHPRSNSPTATSRAAETALVVVTSSAVFPWIDAIAAGEGDGVIAPFARASAGEIPLAAVPGLFIRDANGNAQPTAPPPPPVQMDDLPTPNFDDFMVDIANLREGHRVEVSVSFLPLENPRLLVGRPPPLRLLRYQR